MSVLRKKLMTQSVVTDIKDADVAYVWEDTTEGCLSLLEELTPDLTWTVSDLTTTGIIREELAKALPEDGLYAGLGRDEKVTESLFLFDTTLAAILNKSGIDGRISDLSGLKDHSVSELDLFLMEPLITFLKKDLVKMLGAAEEGKGQEDQTKPQTNRLEFQKEETELTAFMMSDEHKSWRRIEMSFQAQLAEGEDAQPVSLSIILPQSFLEETLEAAHIENETADDVLLPENAKFLGRHIDKSVTSVRAVLDSFQMSVADCTRLEIGQILPLPGVSLENISLEVEMRNQRLAVANGLLGIHKTRRAVKLSEDISDEFRSDVVC
ncbi:hypothetical protein [Litorimonas haliclonae]|uniref:hypothetical protein n=1 Tax=Litorimonas haliclonae TaxID=2081977 RepID=UPI0039F13BCB